MIERRPTGSRRAAIACGVVVASLLSVIPGRAGHEKVGGMVWASTSGGFCLTDISCTAFTGNTLAGQPQVKAGPFGGCQRNAFIDSDLFFNVRNIGPFTKDAGHTAVLKHEGSIGVGNNATLAVFAFDKRCRVWPASGIASTYTLTVNESTPISIPQGMEWLLISVAVKAIQGSGQRAQVAWSLTFRH